LTTAVIARIRPVSRASLFSHPKTDFRERGREASANANGDANGVGPTPNRRHAFEEDEHEISSSKIVEMIDSMIIFRPDPSLQCPMTNSATRRRESGPERGRIVFK
jgi:hypothetical protein